MCRKLYPLISLLIVLATLTSASAVTTQNAMWTTTSRDWFSGTAWSIGAVPTITAGYATNGQYGVTTYNSTGPGTGPLIAGGDATAIEIKIGGANGKINTGYLTMDSGTLGTENFIMVGPDGTVTGGKNGAFVMNGGAVTVGGAGSGVRTNGHLYIPSGFSGNSGVTGTLTMIGGTIDVGGTLTVVRYAGGIGYVNLNGGTITAHAISMQAGAHFNLESGTLIIDGNAVSTIDSYKSSGLMTGYGSASNVQSVYNSGTDKTTVTGVTSSPTRAGNPNPGSGTAGIMLNPTLSWDAGLNTLSYNVYFGTASPGTSQGNQTDANFTPTGPLAANTTYYWRIDSVGASETIEGYVWSFTTGSLKAKTPIFPANAATQVTINPAMTWTPGAGAVSHDVYLGTVNPPTSFVNVTTASYSPATLTTDTTYYWRVDERDGFGGVATGDIWSFSTASSVRKGPYLIYPGNNTQMTVLWQLPSAQSCTLAWGTDTSYSTGSAAVAAYGSDYQYKYTITGLTPGTMYYYRVTKELGPAVTGSFRTAPAADVSSVKFLVYGDTRSYPASHAQIMSRMNTLTSADPAFQSLLLHVGDWVNVNDETHWVDEYFNRSYTGTLQVMASMPIMGCMGNHETTGDGAGLYDKYWPYTYVAPSSGRYYSLDYGPVHIAVLDVETSAYTTGSPQLTWLDNDLATTTKKWKIVMFHEPAWTAGDHPNNATAQTYIQPILKQRGVQVVFGGHNHYYARAVVDGIHHVTTGAGGANFYTAVPGQPYVVTYTNGTLEFCKITVTENTLGVQAIAAADGRVIDSFFVNTAPPDFTFIQDTDPQIGWTQNGNMDAMWPKTITKVNIVDPALMVVTGDLINSKGNTSQVDYFKTNAVVLKPTIPMYVLPGNHDIGDIPTPTDYTFWHTYFASSPENMNPWYSFTYNNSLFICLDSMVMKYPSGIPDANVAQWAWLRSTLASSGGYAHKFVFMHITPCLVSIDEPDQPGPSNSFNMPMSVRAPLLQLFHQYGVEAVFAGHAHYNAYVNDNGLEIITTSSSNSSLGSPIPQGFQLVKVYPDHIEHTYTYLDSIQTLPGDCNGDKTVDMKDIPCFSEGWLSTGIWP